MIYMKAPPGRFLFQKISIDRLHPSIFNVHTNLNINSLLSDILSPHLPLTFPPPLHTQKTKNMPRPTPLLTLLHLTLAISTTYHFLPSFPIIPRTSRDLYINNALNTGRPLTTTHTWDNDFAAHEAYPTYVFSIGILWQLQNASGGPDGGPEKYLRIGEDAMVPFHTIAARATKANAFFDDELRGVAAARRGGGVSVPYFGPAFNTRVFEGGAGDLDERPWFAARIAHAHARRADRILLDFMVEGKMARIEICVVVPSYGVVQVWKTKVVHGVLREKMRDAGLEDPGEMWERRGAFEKGLEGLRGTVLGDEVLRKTYEGLLFGMVEAGLLGEFVLPGAYDAPDELDYVGEGRGILARLPKGELPSRSYPFRRALAGLVKWVSMVISLILSSVESMFRPFGVFTLLVVSVSVFVVFGAWCNAGFPHFVEWTMEYWLLKPVWVCWSWCMGRLTGRKTKTV
ncbi:hypothetical protein DM02DRAFT_685454 [Periconia macrospinosa]|uniref:Uncharacterized protein n=1 Tax=Periconia macrospinosa TaxID=97972 RepID=A0A2V1E4Z4_9PLEO|nr:hypothetical protein DM02DRAFT_685454 [Periconia macrospinosa]